MAFLREVNGGRRFPLPGKVTVIGRDTSCDVVVASGEASRRHALILQSGDAYYVEDLDSANGTSVNGRLIQQRTRLHPDDRLEIPGLEATFHPDGSDAGEADLTLAGLPADAPVPILSSLDVDDEPRVQIEPEAKLRAVLEISRNLANTLNLAEVLPKILESLFTIFPQADRGAILLHDPGSGRLTPSAAKVRRPAAGDPLRFSQTIANHALHTGRALLSADAEHDERFGSAHSIKGLRLHSIMCAPMLSQARASLGVIQIATQDRRRQFRQEDLEVLVSAGTQAARAVELAWLHREQRDLETATQIQKSFLPSERPRVPGLRFFDYYSPARHVGGDYYDYIPLPGDRLAVALGDVSGKGFSAALLMARLSAAARFCLATAPTLAEAARQLNLVLTRAGTEELYVTLVVAVLDLANFSMTLVNAGHLPPLRRGARRAAVEEVGEAIIGLPLAVIDRPYEELVVPLEPGDTLVLYTDGVTEARNAAGEFYGPECLRAVVEGTAPDPEALGTAILADVRRFAAGRPQSDDLTLVCFGREP